jgi:hypothetical protein
MLGLRIGYDRFLAHRLQFIIHKWPHIISATVGAVKQTNDK